MRFTAVTIQNKTTKVFEHVHVHAFSSDLGEKINVVWMGLLEVRQQSRSHFLFFRPEFIHVRKKSVGPLTKQTLYFFTDCLGQPFSPYMLSLTISHSVDLFEI